MVQATTLRAARFQFTGSGAEYFRIWAVNLALTLLTLGVYYPWARVRKLRYMATNTLVDGDALGYHATGWQLFKGFALVIAVLAAANFLEQLFPLALAIAASLGFWLLYPWLWHASMRFRLHQTSWRGLRFRFTGALGMAYAVMAAALLPLAMLSLIVLGPVLALYFGVPVMGWLSAVGFAGFAPAWVAVVLWVRRYQHNNYAYGSMQVGMDVSFLQTLRTGAVSLTVMLLLSAAFIGGLVALIPLVSVPKDYLSGILSGNLGWIIWSISVLFYACFYAAKMYWDARMQNLFWGATGNTHLRFRSDLPVWAYVGLALKNVVLTVITLGLYRPFAVMAVMRARVEALSIESDVDWATVKAIADGSRDGSVGDMAVELEGVDIGF